MNKSNIRISLSALADFFAFVLNFTCKITPPYHKISSKLTTYSIEGDTVVPMPQCVLSFGMAHFVFAR